MRHYELKSGGGNVPIVSPNFIEIASSADVSKDTCKTSIDRTVQEISIKAKTV
jgi:hypothetical protein